MTGTDSRKAATLHVDAGVRYWEDTTVNGEEDETGTLIPFRNGERWQPVIRIADGVILDWPAGVAASIHYKVCDDGIYVLKDASGAVVGRREDDYVPDVLCPSGNGYGDYIIMDINDAGVVCKWDMTMIRRSSWT